MIQNLNVITYKIKLDKNLLEEKLLKYGAVKVGKNQFSCINCKSSDGLYIYNPKDEQGNKKDIWMYNCFPCGPKKTQGNVIDLVQQKENISYIQAVVKLAKELGINIDYNKTEFNESCNHAKYKADEDIIIEKYISQHDLSLELAKAKAKDGENSLIVAPTGSGKTYSIINMLKRDKKTKSIFIVPNSMNVEQIKVEYNVPGAWGDIPVIPELEKGNVIVMTWDKFIQLDEEILKDYIVVLDEVHQTYTEMFRLNKINKLYDNLECCMGQIHITATPSKLNFETYDYIIKYEIEKKTDYKVFLYSNINDETILKITNNSIKFALFKDDAKYLEFVKQNTVNKKVDVITKNTREFSNSYKSIVTNNNIGNFEGICNTSLLTAGVNIYDPDITDIIIVGIKDPATIRQYCARFRDLERVNVHIFNNYQDKDSINKYNIEWAISQIVEEAKEEVEYYNKKLIRTRFREETLNLPPIRMPFNTNFYWSDMNNKYKVNERQIRNMCYSNYYSKVDIHRFKELLQEYFSNVVVISQLDKNTSFSEDFKKVKKSEIDYILSSLEKHKNILVGAAEILTGNITSKTDRYLRENLIVEDWAKEQLTKYKVDKYIKINKIADIISLYSKYVVEDGLTYELAWLLATMGKRSRNKFFNQANFLIYREAEKRYPNLISKTRIQNRLYSFILQKFEPGKWYNDELLQIFCNDVYDAIRVEITPKQLALILNQIFIIKKTRKESCSNKLSIYKEYIITLPEQHNNKKEEYIRFIQDFISFDSVCKQYKLNDVCIESFQKFLRVRINEVENRANDILSIYDLFEEGAC